MRHESPPPRTSVFASDGWHRLVAAICILACVGLVATGIARLINPAEGHAGPAQPMDYIAGVCFIILGIRGAAYLIRQLRAPAPTVPRRSPDTK